MSTNQEAEWTSKPALELRGVLVPRKISLVHPKIHSETAFLCRLVHLTKVLGLFHCTQESRLLEVWGFSLGKGERGENWEKCLVCPDSVSLTFIPRHSVQHERGTSNAVCGCEFSCFSLGSITL